MLSRTARQGVIHGCSTESGEFPVTEGRTLRTCHFALKGLAELSGHLPHFGRVCRGFGNPVKNAVSVTTAAQQGLLNHCTV